MSAKEKLYHELMERHNTMICHLCRIHSIGSDYLYEELRQVAAVHLWREIEAYGMSRWRRQSSEATWIYHIVLYALLSYKRDYLHLTISVAEVDMDRLLSPDDTPPISEIEEIFALLPDKDRWLLQLSLDGFSNSDIACMEQLTTKAVGIRLVRIRKKVKQIMFDLNKP